MTVWDIVQIVLAAGGVIALTVLKVLWTRIEANQRQIDESQSDLDRFRIKVAEEYVRLEFMREFRGEILGHLRNIEAKLDRKADKEK